MMYTRLDKLLHLALEAATKHLSHNCTTCTNRRITWHLAALILKSILNALVRDRPVTIKSVTLDKIVL